MAYAVRFTHTDPTIKAETHAIRGSFDECLKQFMRIVETQQNILVRNLINTTMRKVELLRPIENGNIILASVYLEDLTNEEK